MANHLRNKGSQPPWLLVSEYFPPEIGASQARLDAYTKTWNELWGSGIVLTAYPHYPTGKVPSEYAQGKRLEEMRNGNRILRVPFRSLPETGSQRQRLINQALFGFRLLFAIFRLPKISAVLTEYPPIFILPASWFLARVRRVPWILHLSDCWAQAACDMGALPSPILQKCALWLERFWVSKADGCICVSRGVQEFYQPILGSKPSALIPNGVNLEIYRPQPENRESVRNQRGWNQKFVCLYAGTLGNQQDFDTILQAASLLPRLFHFVLVGSGSYRQTLEENISELALPNVELLDPVPEEELSKLISGADVGLSTLRSLPFCKTVLPVKIWSYMACGLPVVASDFGESGELLKHLENCELVPVENPKALAEMLRLLESRPERRTELALAGREYVKTHRSRQAAAEEIHRFVSQ